MKEFSRFKKFVFIFFLICCSGFIFIGLYNISNRIAFYRNINCVAEWRESEGQLFLYIEADTHYDLGYLTGRELAYKIFLMKDFLISSSSSMGTTYNKLITEARKYIDYIPNKYMEEIEGLSEGATFGSGFSITIEDVLVQTLFFELLYGRLNIGSNTFGCTDIGAKNSDNLTIIGQNMDLIKPMGMVGSFVYHKLKGEYEGFTYRMGGSLALPMGKNEKGLTIVMNLVQINQKASLTTPAAISIREALASEKTASGFVENLFNKGESPYGLNYLVCDKATIIAIQALPDKQYVRIINSTIVHSNTYLKENWEKYLAYPDYSIERQEYTEEQVENAYKDNKLTNSELLNILADRPIICRDQGIIDMATVAFMTTTSFGIGTANDNIGNIPM
ncbi:MAG: C45 family autoproteolytic acyltransferase/hydrolase [Promethearchaeota archaeon]